jgi:hypothetical protein
MPLDHSTVRAPAILNQAPIGMDFAVFASLVGS